MQIKLKKFATFIYCTDKSYTHIPIPQNPKELDHTLSNIKGSTKSITLKVERYVNVDDSIQKVTNKVDGYDDYYNKDYVTKLNAMFLNHYQYFYSIYKNNELIDFKDQMGVKNMNAKKVFKIFNQLKEYQANAKRLTPMELITPNRTNYNYEHTVNQYQNVINKIKSGAIDND